MVGLPLLSTIARDAGYDSSVWVENLTGNIPDDELAEIYHLCVSGLSATISKAKKIARRHKDIRKALNRPSKTAVGGIHASMIPEYVVDDFDQVVVGEAETVILDVLSGDNLEKIVRGERVEDLDSLPIPDLSLIRGYEKIKIIPVVTSRGCPNKCNFCSVTEMFGRDYRSRSPENVMEEVRRYKGRSIFFVDDNFMVHKKRTKLLLEKMIEEDLDIDWCGQVRAEAAKDQEMIALMSRAGCDLLFSGFESIDPASLKEMNKRQSVEDIERAIRVFHENNIRVQGMFILGHDADTKDVFKNVSDFNRKQATDFVQYSILTPFPSTEIYRKLEAEGRILHKNWEYYDGLHAVFKPANMTAEELQRGMVKSYGNFYSYANGIKDAISDIVHAGVTSIKKIYTEAHFRPVSPTLMKFIGRKILNYWVRQNKEYLNYLRDPSNREVLLD
jgi:radical SAM superfamily enzyme YgiQ (UPF0313 family)